jgi:hypothetical protein
VCVFKSVCVSVSASVHVCVIMLTVVGACVGGERSVRLHFGFSSQGMHPSNSPFEAFLDTIQRYNHMHLSPSFPCSSDNTRCSETTPEAHARMPAQCMYVCVWVWVGVFV